MSDELQRNVCGFCSGGIHVAVTRDGRAVWIHDERGSLSEWLARGGNVHTPTPANLEESP